MLNIQDQLWTKPHTKESQPPRLLMRTCFCDIPLYTMYSEPILPYFKSSHNHNCILLCCQHICDAIFSQLHQNYLIVLYKFLPVGNGCRISCHHIINNFHNFAATSNRCTLAEISTLFQLNSEKTRRDNYHHV